MATTTKTDEKTLLAPFEIWEIPLSNGAYIKFFEPLMLQPEWIPDDPDDPDENEYLSVKSPELDLTSWGATRKELWSCIRGDIREVWECFVRIPDDRLSKEGRNIKNAFLAIAEEVHDG